MNENEAQAANDEDEDIYEDIGDFRYDRELAKLEENNKAYSEDIARLSKRINELTEKNKALQNVNDILTTNISILLKTAKAEIERKQLVIDEFRKKIENSNKGQGRNERINSLRSGSFKKSGTEHHFKSSDVEDGEIVEDECEADKFKSDGGRRDGSNNRDKGYHSGKHEKRQSNHERLKGRSNETSSDRRKSRYPDDSYPRHSNSSRSHRRCTSPEKRGHPDNRGRSADKNKHSSKPVHSHGLRSQKTKSSPHRKEQPTRRSRERRLSITKTDSEKSKKESLTESIREESTSKPDSINDNKSRAVKHDATEVEEKELKNEEKSGVINKLSITEYRRRKNSDCSNQKKDECDLLARRSVLSDLYDEPPDIVTEFHETWERTVDEKNEAVPSQSDIEAASHSDWVSVNRRKSKESETVKGHKTLYSRRMEAKFQKKQLLEDKLSRKCVENSSEKQQDKETQPTSREEAEKMEKITAVVEVLGKEGASENVEDGPKLGKEVVANVNCTPEAAIETASESVEKPLGVNLDQSFGESLVKKLLQLQKTEENVGISEFSPLKNNYKLSKISPVKPVSKQHILEYYNLKPSPQQLTNIEPEVLDFSFTLPETPGKNFLNSFLVLNDTKECGQEEENEKCSASSPDENNPTKIGIDDLTTVAKTPKTKKRSSKATKAGIGDDDTSSDSKKSVHTSDEERGSGKSYNTRYHIRTRSKAENDKSNTNESEEVEEKRKRNNGEEEGGLKRERRLSVSEEIDLGLAPKRIKCETPKTENETSIEVTAEGTVPDDISSFEVFRSVSDENVGGMSTLIPRVDEKSTVDDLPSWNGENKTSSNEDESCEMATDKLKPMLSSTGNSGDSSNFKVLRSYLMLSANDDTDDEAFDSDNSSGSGEYSDSGASALVDLL